MVVSRAADAGKIVVDSEGIVRSRVGQRIEGIEVMREVPPGGGMVEAKLTYPVLTDEDGKVDGIDMTLVENRRRLHNETAGITGEDEKELEGRMSNQPQHEAFVFDRCKKQGGGKRWKHEGKLEESLDPTRISDIPKFPLGSVMVVRGKAHED